MRGVSDCPSLSRSTLNSSLSAFLLGAKVFTLDKRGRHCEGPLLIRSSQSGGHGQLERVSWIRRPLLRAAGPAHRAQSSLGFVVFGACNKVTAWLVAALLSHASREYMALKWPRSGYRDLGNVVMKSMQCHSPEQSCNWRNICTLHC